MHLMNSWEDIIQITSICHQCVTKFLAKSQILIFHSTFRSLFLSFFALSPNKLIYCSKHLTHWGWDEIVDISQMTFSNAISWMKMDEFCFRFSLLLSFKLSIFQHWFRLWLGCHQVASHYLNQWWLVYWHNEPQWVKALFWQSKNLNLR